MHLSQAKAAPVKQCGLFFLFSSRGAGITQSATNLDFCILFYNAAGKKCVKATLCLSEGSLVYKAFLSKSVIIYTY